MLGKFQKDLSIPDSKVSY